MVVTQVLDEQERVELRCMVHPRTLALIDAAVTAVPEWKRGEVVDRAVGLNANRINIQGLTFDELRASIDKHEAETLECIKG